ncbi:MAG: AAA family ATPase [Acidimicrobiia bacterium]
MESGPADAADSDTRLEGQRRIVTIVISDLSGYTAMGERLDPEDIAQIMGTIKRDGTAIIESFGGIVNQFIGDEIVSLFGLPSMRDDDPRRAVSAALALHERVDELNRDFPQPLTVPLTMHSGIHAGLVIAEFSDSRSGVYELTGDAINTAARLLGVAGRGEVVIGAPTLAAVEPFFEIEDAGVHQVRGKADPLPAFRVLRPRTHVSRFDVAKERGLTPLAGRGEELSRLAGALDRTTRSEGQTVVVESDAGAGKSRLCFEFVQRQRSSGRDFSLFKGRCQAYGSMTSYLPFIQVVREALALGVNNDVETTRATVPDRVHDLDHDLDRFVPAYLHLLSTIAVDELPGEWRGDALPLILQDAIVALVLASARRVPTVVQLDDWHWADEASSATLLALRRALDGMRILVLVTQRPETAPMGGDGAVEKLNLLPLQRDATQDMIAGYFGAAGVQPELANMIYERTLGNPFFVEEVCRALQEQAEVVADRLQIADDIEALLIPETVQAVVLSRVDSLDPTLRDLLRIASVVGREFSGDVLARLADAKGRVELLEQLDQLDRLGFIEAMAGADGARFRFRHMITQEVTYETLLVRERKAAHGRIASIVEASQSPADIEQLRKVESLAYHYQRAGNSAKALDYFDLAGEKAAARRALAEARQQIQAAMNETFKLEQTAELRARRGTLALRWAAACIFLPSVSQIELLQSVQEETMADANYEVALLANYWINWIQYSVGNQRASEEGTRVLLALVEQAGQDDTAALLRCHLGQVLIIQRRHDEAEQLLVEGLRGRGEQVGELGPGDVELGLYCYALAQQTLIDADRGEFTPPVRAVDEALAHINRVGEYSTGASLLIVSAIARTLRGDWAEVCADIEAIAALPDASVSPYVEVMATVLHGYATFRLGAPQEGLEALRRGLKAHEESEAKLALGLTRALLADALAREGNDEEAASMARAALERGEVGDRIGEDFAACVLLQTDGQTGTDLATSIERLRTDCLAAGSIRSTAMVNLAAAKAYRRAGDIDAATRYATDAIAATTALGMTAYREEAESLGALHNDPALPTKDDR